ncbi:MAG TPA: PEP-utilizing enzyme [Solirubrobacterales bacterium]|jgi:phosphohistidine swiveling domain-containing protein
MEGSNDRLLATGTVASQGTAEGVLTPAMSVAEVLKLMSEDVGEAILWVEHASVTSVVPILPRVRGVVCEGGGLTSHLAIVSRQFGLPCVVAADFSVPPEEAKGRRVEILEDGRIVFAENGA